jgi:hypothetical protein
MERLDEGDNLGESVSSAVPLIHPGYMPKGYIPDPNIRLRKQALRNPANSLSDKPVSHLRNGFRLCAAVETGIRYNTFHALPRAVFWQHLDRPLFG